MDGSIDEDWLNFKRRKSIKIFCLNVFFILPCIVIIALNVTIIAKLKPQLNHYIEPSSIRIGFFNAYELDLIQRSLYVKTSTYEQQIIGNLGDVIFK